MDTNRIEELAQQVVTDDEALTLISVLSSRFGLSTTAFCRADISDMAREVAADVLTDHSPEFLDAVLPAVVDTVQADYEWTSLDEILAERGNEVLAEAVRQVGAPLHGGEYTLFDAQLCVEEDESTVPVVTLRGFTSAQHAYEWAKSLHKRSASEALSSCANTDAYALPGSPEVQGDSQSLLGPVVELHLVIRDTHTGRERTTLRVPLG